MGDGMSCFIQKVHTYVPENNISTLFFYKDGLITRRNTNNLYKRGVTKTAIENKLSGEDMLMKVIEPIFEDDSIDPRKIKFLILPYLAYFKSFDDEIFNRIRERFGIFNATCYSVMDLACATFLKGLNIGTTYMKNSNKGDIGIIALVEKMTLPYQRHGDDYFITGDSSAALVLNNNGNGDEILSISDYMYTQNLDLKIGKLDGPVVVDHTILLNLSKVLYKSLKEAKVSIDQIKLFIPTNGPKETWDYLRRLMRIPEGRFFLDGTQKIGHMNNCDLLLNYQFVVSNNLLRKDDYFAIMGIGLGGGMGCAICRKA